MQLALNITKGMCKGLITITKRIDIFLTNLLDKGETCYDISSLVKFANYWTQSTYGVKLRIPIKIYKGLDCCGEFVYTNTYAKQINISVREFNKGSQDVLDTLIHELTHYCLYELDLPHKDTDLYFQNDLKRNTSPRKIREAIETVYLMGCRYKERRLK
jgi:SprT-like protein